MTLKISRSQVSTQPNPTHQKLKTLTQPNPTHGWTQPMTNSTSCTYTAKHWLESKTVSVVAVRTRTQSLKCNSRPGSSPNPRVVRGLGWPTGWVELGWVGNGSKICVFSGFGWVMGLEWQMSEKYMSCIYVTLCRVSTGKLVLWKLAVGASLLHLSEIGLIWL